MLPVAALPICGILMGIGYLMCPSTMQGGTVEGLIQQIGYFLVQARRRPDRQPGDTVRHRRGRRPV